MSEGEWIMKRILYILLPALMLCSCSSEDASSIKKAKITTSASAVQTTQVTPEQTTAETTQLTTTTADDDIDDDIYTEPEAINAGHEIIGEIDGNSYAAFSGKLTENGKASPLAEVIIQRENYTHHDDDKIEMQYYIPYNRLSDLGAAGLYKDGSVVGFSADSGKILITDGELVVTDSVTGETEYGLCGNIELNGTFYVGFKNLVPLFGGKITEYTDPASPYIIQCNFEL